MSEKIEIIKAAKLATEMTALLFKHLHGKDNRYAFTVGNSCLSSIIAVFVDRLFSDKYPEKKEQFIEQLIMNAQMMLEHNQEMRKSNQEDVH